MPERFTARIADRFTFHAVDITRFEAHLQSQALRLLHALEGKIQQDLDRLDPTTTTQKRRRLQALLKAVKSNIQTAYSGIKRMTEGELLQFAEIVAESTAETINEVAKVSILNVGLPKETLRAILDNTIVQGAPAREWWSRQAGNTYQRFANEIREGVFRGETLSELVRRIRGTQAAGFKDGVMETSRREAETLIRTSVQSINNAARLETFQQNDDVIKGLQALVTLDLRTSEICRGRAGFAWYLDGRPLTRQTNIPFPGPPPWHFNCRTTLVPITFSWEELIQNKRLGKKVRTALQNLPKSTQASMDGQAAEDMTYEEWLKTKPEAVQQQVLGLAKWQLWKDGQISLRDMIDQRGRPLTIEQLRERLRGAPPPPEPPPPPPPPPPEPPEPPAPPPAPPEPPPPPPEPPKPPRPKRLRKPKVAPSEGTPTSPWTEDTPGFEWHEAAMKDAPDWVKRAIGTLPPIRKVMREAKTSSYVSRERRIRMETLYTPHDPTGQAIWRHEYGHHLDAMLGQRIGVYPYISTSRDWEKVWRADAKRLIDSRKPHHAGRLRAEQRAKELVAQMSEIKNTQGHEARERWIREVFSRAGLHFEQWFDMIKEGSATLTPYRDSLRLLAAWEEGAATNALLDIFATFNVAKKQMGLNFMDMLGALTKNKVGFGHRPEYYNEQFYRQGTEAFANAFSMLSHKNPMWGKLAERFASGLTRLIQGALQNVTTTRR